MLSERLPANAELVRIYDQSTFISQAIGQVRSAALLGGLLAVLVLYAFLRDARATFIIGLAIPVSVIGTFVLMYASDITLNIMSLGGIALAVGLLVDNSIVVLENIVRKKEQGLDVLNAARRGTSEVATAVIAATLTTVAVFFPMVFVSGIAGQLFRDQALTVTFALLFSLLVALTLIPMLAALRAGHRFSDLQDVTPPGRFTRMAAAVVRLLRWVFRGMSTLMGWILRPLVWLFQGFYALLARVYPHLLGWSLRHRWVIVLASAGALAATLSLVPRLGSELIPQLSQGEFNVKIRLPSGAPLSATDRALQQVQKAAAGLDNLDLSFSVAGTGNRLDASPVDAGENTGELNVRLRSGASRRRRGSRDGVDASGAGQHSRRVLRIQSPCLFSFRTPLEIEITGFDLAQLESVTKDIVRQLDESPRFADIKSTVEAGNPEIQILFDQERAARLGLVVRDVADVVVNKVRGQVATRYTWRDKKIDVLVRSVDTRRSSVTEIEELIINPMSDRPIPLKAVADIQITTGPAEIRRHDQERVAVISANLSYGDLAAAVEEVSSVLRGTSMPSGITAFVTGQSEEMPESFRSMLFTLAMAIFLVYLVMASQFESLIHPFVILFTIPLALVGAVLALFLTGTTDQRGGVYRPDHARRYRGQQRHRADRPGQPAPRRRHVAYRSDHGGGPGATAADPDDHADHDPRSAADGARLWRGRRSARTDGDHGDRRPPGLDLPDPAGDTGGLLAA